MLTEFQKAVESGLEGLDAVSPGAMPDRVCCEDNEHDEPYFSWSPCDCCSSRLGGDRYAAHGIDEDGDIVHLDVCVDCLMYLANGDEPEDWGNE